MDQHLSREPQNPAESPSPQIHAILRNHAEIRDMELLRSVVDLTTDAIFVKDLEGKYLLFNQAASDFVGRPVQEVLGRDDSELFAPESFQLVRRRDQLVIESGKPMVAEERLISAGTERTYLASKVPLRNPEGDIVGVIGISRDISDRKRSEEQVLRHQAFLEAIIQTAAEGICVFEQLSPVAQPRFSVWNDRMVELTGYTLEEVNNLTWNHALALQESQASPSDLPFLNLYSQENQREIEGRVRRKDGTVRIFSASTTQINLGEGTCTYVAMIQDVTERRTVEQAYRASDQRFRLFMENLPGRAWIKSADRRYVYVNRRMQQEFARSSEEFLGKRAEDIYAPESADLFNRNDELALSENNAINIVESIRRMDGELEWAHVSKFPIPSVDDQPHMIGGVAFDITHLRRVEQALRESEERFRVFMENIPGPAWIKDENQRYQFVNPALTQHVYRTQEQFLGHTDTEIFDPDTAAAYQANDQAALREGKSVHVIETALQPDGSRRYYHVSKFPMPQSNGAPPMVGGFAVDITEKLHSEDERRLSEERLRVAQSLAHIGSFYWAICGKDLYWSDELYRIYGYEPRSIIPNFEMYLAHIHLDDVDRIRLSIDKTLAEKSSFQHEYRIRTLYNELRWVMATGRCVLDEYGAVIAVEGTCQDISERKNLEDQLQQSQKMEAIGLLAGGVAHDFNNLLTVITGYTYMMLGQSELPQSMQESLLAIQDAAHRAASLTRQLLTFSRRQRLEPVILDLNDIIRGLEKLLQRFVGPEITVVLELSDNLGLIRIDAAQVEQVLINLAVNARDAMPRGGEFRIVTRNAVESVEPQNTGTGQLPRRNFVELFVIDNGEGMSEEVRRRIFEPFFTTKGIGKGTGLGLAVVHGIVQQSGGDILVQTKSGHGTVFRIRLPIVSEIPVDGDLDTTIVQDLSKTVLLVDDDEAVRRVTRVTLESNGFIVQEAENADDALSLINRADQPIDLLVTDVAMPGVGGRELAVRVIQKLPEIRVLFISGYTNSAGLQEGLSVPNDFLEKPFTPHELVARVESLIRFVSDQRA